MAILLLFCLLNILFIYSDDVQDSDVEVDGDTNMMN